MFPMRFIPIVVLVILLNASAVAGSTYAVGTCLPSLPFYSTISEAVSSVPSGSTIKVCPGSYAEQILITQPLTLEGIRSGGSDMPLIFPPFGGITQVVNGPGGTTACQILVRSTGLVNISGLGVEGSGAIVNNGSYLAGIAYEDASGTVSHVSIRNQVLEGFGGIGFVTVTNSADAQTVTIEESLIRGFDGVGIWSATNDGAGVMTTNIKTNTIRGTLSSSIGINGQRSDGLVQSNVVSNVGQGVYLLLSGAKVTTNTISVTSPGTGVSVESGSSSVTGNRIDAGGGQGVALYDAAAGSVVKGNTIVNSLTAVFGCGYGTIPPGGPASGFAVSGNVIMDAAIGLQMPSGNTSAPNRYYATGSAVGYCY